MGDVVISVIAITSACPPGCMQTSESTQALLAELSSVQNSAFNSSQSGPSGKLPSCQLNEQLEKQKHKHESELPAASSMDSSRSSNTSMCMELPLGPSLSHMVAYPLKAVDELNPMVCSAELSIVGIQDHLGSYGPPSSTELKCPASYSDESQKVVGMSFEGTAGDERPRSLVYGHQRSPLQPDQHQIQPELHPPSQPHPERGLPQHPVPAEPTVDSKLPAETQVQHRLQGWGPARAAQLSHSLSQVKQASHSLANFRKAVSRLTKHFSKAPDGTRAVVRISDPIVQATTTQPPTTMKAT
eukprot:gene26081-11785_t